MTPRRIETRIPREQPVRFYKIIALSFLGITLILLGIIVFMSSKRATITISTKNTPTDVQFQVDAEDVGGTFSTSTVVLTSTFSPQSDTKIPGEATGIMTIVNTSASAQPLVATTRFLSEDEVLFRLRERVVVPANGEITAEVYADQEGESGNVEPGRFTIPGLNEVRQAQVYGELKEPTSGGLRSVGLLTQADVDRAEKMLLEEAQAQVAQTESRQDVVTLQSILSHATEIDAVVGEEVSQVRMTLTAEVITVTYNQSAVTAQATDALDSRIVDETEIVEATSDKPRVAFDKFEDGVVTLSVFFDGVAQLNPESEQLEKFVFFGMTREEIRRYVLSLDHVHSVDIKFQPAWMQTVPHVNEHLDVIIKSVR